MVEMPMSACKSMQLSQLTSSQPEMIAVCAENASSVSNAEHRIVTTARAGLIFFMYLPKEGRVAQSV